MLLNFEYRKSHVKVLGLYNFIRGFGWAYKWGKGGGLKRGIKEMFWNDKIKLYEKQIKANIPLHLELY